MTAFQDGKYKELVSLSPSWPGRNLVLLVSALQKEEGSVHLSPFLCSPGQQFRSGEKRKLAGILITPSPTHPPPCCISASQEATKLPEWKVRGNQNRSKVARRGKSADFHSWSARRLFIPPPPHPTPPHPICWAQSQTSPEGNQKLIPSWPLTWWLLSFLFLWTCANRVRKAHQPIGCLIPTREEEVSKAGRCLSIPSLEEGGTSGATVTAVNHVWLVAEHWPI